MGRKVVECFVMAAYNELSASTQQYIKFEYIKSHFIFFFLLKLSILNYYCLTVTSKETIGKKNEQKNTL